jgi:hypothetical protein
MSIFGKFKTLRKCATTDFYEFDKTSLMENCRGFLNTIYFFCSLNPTSLTPFLPQCKRTVVEGFMFRGRFIEHLGLTEVAQQSVAKIKPLTNLNLIAPKVGAKHEHLIKNLPQYSSVLYICVQQYIYPNI